MKTSLRDKRKPKRQRLSVATLIFALFFTAIMPFPAKAVLPVACADCDTATAAVGTLITGLQGALTFVIANMQAVLAYIQQMGFSAVAASVSAQTVINGKIQELTANFHAQTAMYVPQVSYAAQAQAQSMISSQSIVCQRYQYEQAKQRLDENPVAIAISSILSNDCKGPNADCAGPARQGEIYDDSCKLGFVSQVQYGGLTTGVCTPAPDQSYVDRDLKRSMLINTKQMVFASPCILADGYPSFSGTGCQGGTTAQAKYDPNPSQSQLAWVAAFKYCESLDVPVSTPTYGVGRAINPSDKVSINNDRRVTSLRLGGARQACIDLLAERTACPDPSLGVSEQAVGGANNESCHSIQVNICHALRGDPNPQATDSAGVLGGTPTFPANANPGSGTVSAGDPGMGYGTAAALANCDTYGLSPLMAKWIEMHPYSDLSHILSHAGRTKSEDDEREADSGATTLNNEWDKYIAAEDQKLETAIGNSIQLRAANLGGLPAPSGGAR